MPNIKSAMKRVKVTKTKRANNMAIKSELKTAVKKAKEAIGQGSENAAELLKDAVSLIDKASRKNILHKNTAARKKSRLTQALNKISS